MWLCDSFEKGLLTFGQMPSIGTFSSNDRLILRRKAEDMKRQETASPAEVECWMREYGNEILRIAYLYVGDLQAAEDIFQEVFLKAYQGFAEFQGKSSVKTWLIRIAINSCKDYLKSAWKRRVTPMDEAVEQSLRTPDVYEQAEQRADAKKVRETVLSLPEQYREVIVCFFYQELSLEETAQTLHIPLGTVKSRLSRAKEKLKVLLRGGEEDGGSESKSKKSARHKK